MIEVKNLVKKYDANSKPALDGVSFVLPDSGFIFITGKSGSGKTTLLNLLGTLDGFDSGSIVVDGNNYSTLTEEQFDGFRGGSLGFVFQEFCLIDNLTVKQNILLSTDIKKDSEQVNEIVRKVELDGYENKLVKQLSGGQKQRVAIARALIRGAKIILADEPTGNLDSKTSRQILELLKEISKDNLVVTVSHNSSDALEFADRIIELSDGKIVSDTLNENSVTQFEVTKYEVLLPYGKPLTKEEMRILNEQRAYKRIIQKKPKASFVRNSNTVCHHAEIKGKKLSINNIFKYAFGFFKDKKIAFLVNALLMSFIIICISLFQMLLLFDGKEATVQAFSGVDETCFTLNKGYVLEDYFQELKKDKLVRVTDEDIQSIYDMGYEGKIYKLINSNTGPQYNALEIFCPVNEQENFSEFYARGIKGVLICDKQFLVDKYGKDGELDVIAGTLDYAEEPHGMILTDYMADSLLYQNTELINNGDNYYKTLVDMEMITNRYSVLGVINTNYRERYSDLLEKFVDYVKANTKVEKDFIKTQILKMDNFTNFYDEITQYLSVAYSFNPNYIADASDSLSSRCVAYFSGADIYDEEGNVLLENYIDQVVHSNWNDSNVAFPDNNEIYLNYSLYNTLFGAELDRNDLSTFVPRTITIKNYETVRGQDANPLYEITLNVVGVNSHTIVSDEVFKLIRDYDVYTYGLYFDNPVSIASLFNETEKMAFYPSSQKYDSIFKIVGIVSVFQDYFIIIIAILCVTCSLIATFFSVSNVRSHRYQMGVMRALGSSTKRLSIIFFIHSILLGLFVTIFSFVGIIFFTDLVNTVMVDALITYFKSPAISLLQNVTILRPSATIFITDTSIAFLLIAVSSFVSAVSVKKIKPIQMIRNK